MGNFDFVQVAWLDVHGDCARAESYLASDPRSACFYARRAVEQLVGHLYDLLGLPLPYRDDLAARINDAAFRAEVGIGIAQKLTLIRKLGNTAVHEQRPIPSQAARSVLTELHHVLVWAVFHHSPTPQAAPMRAQFDPALAAKAAPLSRAELVALAEKFAAQDAAHAKELAERDELAAAKDVEIARLREQIAAVQADTTTVDDRDYGEAGTRDEFIDVLLREAGWPLSDARDREYKVTGMPTAGGTGFADYVLWGSDGLPLAVVEAKRAAVNPEVGRRQAELYAGCLEREFGRRPVIFYTNGHEHWLWDDESGYPPRPVQGFFTRNELELMIQRRATRRPLAVTQIAGAIAGRPYQTKAIRAIDKAFDGKQREALLVMATGAGKTRTIIALVDQLMKANWAKRVLFLADREALVRQAASAFRAHLPGSTTVNLLDEKNADGRVYVSTYPTMLNLINDTEKVLRRFGPGYFDLVVIDEAHRSVYAKYGVIFDWFDALLVGLTATPKDEVDHNTYRLFRLEDGVPTDAYPLDEAVRDGWLVPPRGVAVGTKFLRHGIRYADLSEEEKERWDALDWGDGPIPDEVGAEELNRFLFNEDTVDKALATLMVQGYKVGGGDRIGKTIIFAKNQNHAEFIQRRFDRQYPHLAGRYARVITHATPYAQSLIDDFSQADKAPHIAISVDMLDTGIDVPEVVNLVFFKMVRSTSKFWQMIGRGTRLCPDLFGPGIDKTDFLVFDFCGNLEFFSQNLPSSEGSIRASLTQRLFETRLAVVCALDAGQIESALREDNARTLHRYVAGMTVDNVIVRPHRRLVERYASWEAWKSLTPEQAGDVLHHLAGLPSTDSDDDEDAKRFDLLMLRRQLAQLDADVVTAERIRETVQTIAAALLTRQAIPSVAEQVALLDEVAGDEWWIDVTLAMLEHARRRLRGLVRFVERAAHHVLYTDFADEFTSSTEVALPQVTPGTDTERFRAKATAYLRAHEDHVALQRLRRNRQLTPDDLTALEKMLLASGVGDEAEIVRAAEGSQGLGLFIRSLVGLDRQAAAEPFSRYLDGTTFTVEQIRFVNLIVDELTANGMMEPERLFESPYTDHAPTGPDLLFPEADVTVIVDILQDVKGHAIPREIA